MQAMAHAESINHLISLEIKYELKENKSKALKRLITT